MSTQEQWCDWLAKIGFGIDFGSDHTPPCSIEDLARAYTRIDPDLHGVSVDEVEDAISLSYGWETE